MRTLTRKLLSLLLAFTMVCAMVPAAMAAETKELETNPTTTEDTEDQETPEDPSDGTGGNEDGDGTGEGDGSEETPGPGEHEHKYTEDKSDPRWKDATCTEDGTKVLKCSVEGCNETKTETVPALGHDYKQTYNNTNHWKECTRCDVVEEGSSAPHTWKSSNEDGWEVKEATCTEDGSRSRACSVCAYSETQEIKATGHQWENNICTVCGEKYDDTPVSATLQSSLNMNSGEDEVVTFSLRDKYGNITHKTDDLYVSSTEEDVAYAYLNRNKEEIEIEAYGSGTTTIKLKYGNKDLASLKVTVKNDFTVNVTVYNSGTYALGDPDIDNEDSVVDQISDKIYSLTNKKGDLDYVEFTSVKSSHGDLDADKNKEYGYDDLADITFIPEEDYTGNVSFSFIAYDDYYDRGYSGTIVFKVEEGTASAGDIIYPAKSGEDVEFDVNDFEDFWEDKYSKGSLDYVTFGSISSSRGDLVDADGDKVTSKKDYYVDPGKRELALDGVTFEPGRNTNSAVTIDFTAYGTNNKSINGTVVILYTEKDPEAIVYSSTGKNITLDADDFLDNYKDTMGSSASNIQIQFLEVPSNGTLYYKYNERTEKGTELTSKNVANHTFSTSSRASKSIEDVTYVPDSRGRSDTVRFACYTSGGDLRYYGEVTFGQTVQNVTVNMTSTSSGVTFQASTFFNADDALLSANTISFGTPSSGTLYKNWNGTSGTRVTASDMFSYVASVTGNASISTVTYVPVAGYSGTVTIPFSAYGAAGGIVSGTVSIRVTATTPTTIFTDVPTTGSQAWAYPFINRLATAGVVSGVTPTTYGPKQTVKWGEALKMVLLGAGHPAQVEGTGSNWASGYLTYAVNNGIVSNTNINLSSNITRLEMAELAAKALGMSPASRINTGIVGPTDTTNGYVYALYNAGIVGGDSSSGQNRYNGGSTLLRDEMAKIVCGVMDNA